MGHIPPGVSPDLWKWMYPDINAKLTDIMRKYHDVILAGIFGHEHTDNFRIIYDENGNSILSHRLSLPSINCSLNQWEKIIVCVIERHA